MAKFWRKFSIAVSLPLKITTLTFHRARWRGKAAEMLVSLYILNLNYLQSGSTYANVFDAIKPSARTFNALITNKSTCNKGYRINTDDEFHAT